MAKPNYQYEKRQRELEKKKKKEEKAMKKSSGTHGGEPEAADQGETAATAEPASEGSGSAGA